MIKRLFWIFITICLFVAGGISYMYSRLDIDQCRLRETTKLDRDIYVLPEEGTDCSLGTGYSYFSITNIGVETHATAYIIDDYVMSKFSEDIDVDDFPERYELESPFVEDGVVAVGDLDFDGLKEVYVYKWLGGTEFEIYTFKNITEGFVQTR